MVLYYNYMEISSLDDIQKLKAKDLREILKSNSEQTSGIRADLLIESLCFANVTRPSIDSWRKPRTSYRCPGPRRKPERLQKRSDYGKDFSSWMVERSP